MTDKKTIWVLGAKGFLGSEVVNQLKALDKYVVVGTDKELSVAETERMEAFATEVQPDVIVNCAGIPRAATGLSNRIKAYEVNALGARNVALVANGIGAKLVHISTDDVFPSRVHEAVNEFDTPHPDTPYGKSKRAGEMMVRDTMADHIIIRSSWLYYATGGKIKAMLDGAAKGEKYVARVDQFAAPASVDALVEFIDKAIDANVTGTFHVNPKGRVSRYDFMRKVLEICGINPSDVLVSKDDLVTAENLILESLMLEMVGVEIPTWEEELERHLKRVGLAK